MSVALVQKAAFTSAEPGTSLSITLNSVTAGNFLLCGFFTDAVITTLSSIVDSNGTPQTALAYASATVSTSPAMGVYYEPSAAAGTHTFTGTTAASTDIVMIAAEFSGGISSVDVVSPVANGVGTAISSANITPSQNNDFLFGIALAHGAPSSISGWGAPLVAAQSGAYQPYVSWAWAQQGTAVAVATSATVSATSYWAAAILSFKVGSAPSITPGQFFFSANRPRLPALAALGAVGWVIGRRNRVGRGR